MKPGRPFISRLVVWASIVFALPFTPPSNASLEMTVQQMERLVFDALAKLDPCTRALVERVVLNQGAVVSNNDFHQIGRTFEELGFTFDKIEHADIPLTISDNFASHTVLSVVRIHRGELYTEFSTEETRVGVPLELAEAVKARFGWPESSPGIYQGVFGRNGGQTRGLAELMRIQFEQAGAGPLIREEIEQLETAGAEFSENIAHDAIAFYLEQIKRRKWSEETKARLVKEYYEFLPRSVLAVTRSKRTHAIVGTLQMIRAPFGRRVHAVDEGEKFRVLTDEVGAWGRSVRKFGIRSVDTFDYTEEQLYRRMCEFRLHDGSLRLIKPPVEIKMNEQLIGLKRTCEFSDFEEFTQDGQQHVIFWGEGEVDEPARFAIDPDYNPDLFVETFIQLSTSAIDPHFSMEYNLKNRLLVTYNDLPSLYRWANLKPAGKSLIIDGKEWPILMATGQEHINALLAFARPLNDKDAAALATIKARIVKSLYGPE